MKGVIIVMQKLAVLAAYIHTYLTGSFRQSLHIHICTPVVVHSRALEASDPSAYASILTCNNTFVLCH